MWDLTKEKFSEFKKNYQIKRYETITDEYGIEKKTFTTGGTIKAMWQPVTDEADVEAYGQDVREMLQAVIYGDAEFTEGDRLTVDGREYSIYAIRRFQNYRLTFIKRITAK